MTVHLSTPAVTLHHGDCLEVMASMPENSVDAIVTDPPYGLGFMGKKWDDLPPGADFAEQAYRVLKPGAHILAFGGTRTWHRLAVAIEDAGFEIRDSIAWLYGSGFPKGGLDEQGRGTALKPAFEPVVVARKPFVGTVAANVAMHGTGALHIDACRIEGQPRTTHADGNRVTSVAASGHLPGKKPHGPTPAPSGRFPANVMLDESQARELDEQSGTSKSPATYVRSVAASGGAVGWDPEDEGSTVPGYADTGGASRFFYVAKAPKRERPNVGGIAHPTVKPLTLMRYLVRLVTPPGGTVLDPFAGSGTTLEAALIESIRAIGIEHEQDYLPLIAQRLGSR